MTLLVELSKAELLMGSSPRFLSRMSGSNPALLYSIAFAANLTSDPIVLARAHAAKTTLPGAVYQTARGWKGGVAAAFQGKAGPDQNQTFVDVFNQVYTRYVSRVPCFRSLSCMLTELCFSQISSFERENRVLQGC